MTRDEVIQLAKQQLAQVGHGIKFEVIEAGVRQEDSWWYLPVLAERNGKELPREFTINVYANIEDELDQKHKVSVLFVPVTDPNLN